MAAPLPPFTTQAANLWAATLVDPTIDPSDPTMVAYPPMATYGCLSLPGMPCGQSALRLAYSVNRPQELHPPTTISVVGDGITVPEMKRRLMRLGMPKFPIYSLVIAPFIFPLAPPHYEERREFLLLSGQPREDGWAILFVPSDPALGLVNAHFTFTTILPRPPVQEIFPQPNRRLIFHTHLPITSPSDNVYWRARLNPENLVHFAARKALGLACDCKVSRVCVHELQAGFQAAHRVVFGDEYIEGGYRAEIFSTYVNGWRGSQGPNFSFVVEDPTGSQFTQSFGFSNSAISKVSGVCLKLWNVVWGVESGILPYSSFEDVNVSPYRLRLYRYAAPSGVARAVAVYLLYVTFAAVIGHFLGQGIARRSIEHTKYREAGSFTPTLPVIRVANPFRKKEYTFRFLSFPLCHLPTIRIPNPFNAYYNFKAFLFRTLNSPKRIAIATGVAFAVGFALQHALPMICAHHSGSFVLHKVNVHPPQQTHRAIPAMSVVLPKYDQIISRLNVRETVTREAAVDIVRRVCNESGWPNLIERPDFEAWLERVVTEKGMMTSIELPKPCWTCGRTKEKCKHHECKPCRLKRRSFIPEQLTLRDYDIVHIGVRGIWSSHYRLPEVEFKADTVMRGPNGIKITKRSEFNRWFKRQYHVLSCRGRNCGPVFMSQQPVCFPHGTPTALAAFCVRLGCIRLHEAQDEVYDLAFELLEHFGIDPLTPESHSYFITHFRGLKRTKMLEAYDEVNEGWCPGPGVVKMKGFTKAEKSWNFSYTCTAENLVKNETKPRFICSPNPIILERLGRFTHAQTKWLARKFHCRSHLYYAGCSTPDELNQWLQWSLECVPEPVTLADDISAMDSNHSRPSFEFHRRVRMRQFMCLTLGNLIESWYSGEEHLVIRVADWLLSVSYVNASGVSDTSYKNTLICLFIRLLAVAYGVSGSFVGIVALALRILPRICLSASGDDGLVRCPDELFGVYVESEVFRKRYLDFWSMAGFSVKLQVYPAHRWRLATYLAMRPIWGGSAYIWTPEPARRLRGLFWQIDSGMHPAAWSAGVARQVLFQSPSCPILAPVCRFLLRIVPDLHADVLPDNPFSPLYGYKSEGVSNSRAISEFCIDYRLRPQDLERFYSLLSLSSSHLVDVHCFALDRVFQEE